jgi:hypothetical protein
MWSRRERRQGSEPREGKIKGTLQCRVSRCLHIGSSEGFPHDPSKRAPSPCFPSIVIPTPREQVFGRYRCSQRTRREVCA